jgi:hypothetical protein
MPEDALHYPSQPCVRCHVLVPVPRLPADVRARVLGLAREQQRLAAVPVVTANSALNLTRAKSFVFHLTKVRGECHRCRSQLEMNRTDCSRCHSLNLDW